MRHLFFYLMQYLLIVQRNRLIASAVRGCKVVGDFGCGHFANKYATVCIDKAETEDIQRGFLGVYRGTKKFYDVDLNVYPWPFQDKHFDFAICTQVLEHLREPVKACAELSRVAKAGYVEVPYWCVDAYIRNADAIHESLCAWDETKRTLMFWERAKFLAKHQPCEMPIVTRFLMQVRKEIRILWKDEIKAIKDDVAMDE